MSGNMELQHVDRDNKTQSLPNVTATKLPNIPELEKSTNDEIYSDMIPDDLLFALTEVNDLLEAGKHGQLAPVKTLKTPKEMRVAVKKGPPDNAWHHKNRRVHLRHLTDHPKSDGKTMGTKDISFLYDIVAQKKPVPEKPSKMDKSAVRLHASRELKAANSSSSQLAVPDTIIPEEYYLVKSKAVLGLEYIDEKQTTNLEDREKTLRVFPSLKPTKRFEVLQLMKTMDQMLARAGVDDIRNEAKGPTQIHNLLEIIRKEQQIYDIVFHEVIRQVSIECVDRGQLLSKLRQRYAELLNRIPRQIKSLHAEVMAQRSLDRRLTEELLRFKTSIGSLTDELFAVKEHDKTITQQAQSAQVNLEEALKESQKNANLVDEYHDLYELQRNRLEHQVTQLTDERDLWCNASYSLALKIIAENSLNTSKRLHVTEKAWHKLAGHFTVLISDHDTESLTHLQEHVENWRDLLFHFNQVLEAADKTTTGIIKQIMDSMKDWIRTFEDTLIHVNEETDTRSIQLPVKDMIVSLQQDVSHWEETIGEESERFGGDTLLHNQEQLIKMGKEVDTFTDIAIVVYDRHRSDTGETYPLHKVMGMNNEVLQDLRKQLEIRISGENGVAKGMISIQNSLDIWNNKLVISMKGAEAINESEWLKLYDNLVDYVALLTETLTLVGSQETDEDRNNPNAEHHKILVDETLSAVHSWLKSTVNGIDGENGKMIAIVSNTHKKMVHWMVQMLLHLAPEKGRKIPSESSLEASCSLTELHEKCKDLCDQISRITFYICQCTHSIVQSSMQKKKDAGDDDADHEYRDFMRVKSECKEWIRTCQLLLNSLLDEPVKLFDKTIQSRLEVPKKRAGKKMEEDKETPLDREEESSLSSNKKPLKSVVEPQEERKEEKREENSKSKDTAHDKTTTTSQDPAPTPAIVGKDIKETTKHDVHESKESLESAVSKTSGISVQEKEAEKQQTEDSKEESLKSAVSKASGISVQEKETEKEQTGDSKVVDSVKESESSEKINQPTQLVRSMEVIGSDENVQSTSLNEALLKKSSSQEIGGFLSPPSSALTQTAYDAIAKMDELQNQLLETETRAQESEFKVVQLEENLNETKERIRALERQVQGFEKRESEKKEDSETVKPETSPQPPKSPQNAQESTSPTKPGTAESGKRSSSRAGDRKKTKSKKK